MSPDRSESAPVNNHARGDEKKNDPHDIGFFHASQDAQRRTPEPAEAIDNPAQ